MIKFLHENQERISDDESRQEMEDVIENLSSAVDGLKLIIARSYPDLEPDSPQAENLPLMKLQDQLYQIMDKLDTYLM